MTNIAINSTQFNKAECMFTELFSLLKKYENPLNGTPTLAYNPEELKVINCHVDNAIDTLLQGLQDLGQLVSIVMQDRTEVINEINNIGCFISAISNLTEALNYLRTDTNYVLKDRGIIDY